MECGGLSVMEETGTPWMPLWCAGSSATSMKVRPLFKKIEYKKKKFITYIRMCDLMKALPSSILLLLQAIKTWNSIMIPLSWILVELVWNGEVLETLISLWITLRLVLVETTEL